MNYQTDTLLRRLMEYYVNRGQVERYADIEHCAQSFTQHQWDLLKADAIGHSATAFDVFLRLGVFSQKAINCYGKERHQVYFQALIIQTDKQFRLVDSLRRFAREMSCSQHLQSALGACGDDLPPSLRVRATIEAGRAGKSELIAAIGLWSKRQVLLNKYEAVHGTALFSAAACDT